mmetsp:Transcript_45086/g.133481  ORF Transcript_45086/g.133481 Transcript_45086/m.133481 type:complete len:403 (+) Transcript_45086:93-1301(+)
MPLLCEAPDLLPQGDARALAPLLRLRRRLRVRRQGAFWGPGGGAWTTPVAWLRHKRHAYRGAPRHPRPRLWRYVVPQAQAHEHRAHARHGLHLAQALDHGAHAVLGRGCRRGRHGGGLRRRQGPGERAAARARRQHRGGGQPHSARHRRGALALDSVFGEHRRLLQVLRDGGPPESLGAGVAGSSLRAAHTRTLQHPPELRHRRRRDGPQGRHQPRQGPQVLHGVDRGARPPPLQERLQEGRRGDHPLRHDHPGPQVLPAPAWRAPAEREARRLRPRGALLDQHRAEHLEVGLAGHVRVHPPRPPGAVALQAARDPHRGPAGHRLLLLRRLLRLLDDLLARHTAASAPSADGGLQHGRRSAADAHQPGWQEGRRLRRPLVHGPLLRALLGGGQLAVHVLEDR